VSIRRSAAEGGWSPESVTHARAQELLREALGDPTLALALAAPSGTGFIDAAGESFELPAGGADPATTVLSADGRPIAAVLHDPLLDVDASVVEGLTETVLMLLENARVLGELQVSRRRMLAYIQRDRIRLERDLHDGAAQRLIAMQIRLEALREKIGRDGELATELGLISAQALAALDEVRAVGDGIYPTVLQDFGLPTALQSAAFFLPLEIQVSAEEVGRLDPSLETTVYFCVIEALRNVVAHAGPNVRATVALRRPRGVIEFEVADDGAGFSAKTTPWGLGLLSIVDRAEALGGTAEVRSAPGGGTSVTATIPMLRPSAAPDPAPAHSAPFHPG
jgi:signal transduction histidine kinase